MGGRARRRLSYPLIRADLHLRRKILAKDLPLDDFDMIIGEHPADSELVFEPTTPRKLYDCHDPVGRTSSTSRACSPSASTGASRRARRA